MKDFCLEIPQIGLLYLLLTMTLKHFNPFYIRQLFTIQTPYSLIIITISFSILADFSLLLSEILQLILSLCCTSSLEQLPEDLHQSSYPPIPSVNFTSPTPALSIQYNTNKFLTHAKSATR